METKEKTYCIIFSTNSTFFLDIKKENISRTKLLANMLSEMRRSQNNIKSYYKRCRLLKITQRLKGNTHFVNPWISFIHQIRTNIAHFTYARNEELKGMQSLSALSWPHLCWRLRTYWADNKLSSPWCKHISTDVRVLWASMSKVYYNIGFDTALALLLVMWFV